MWYSRQNLVDIFNEDPKWFMSNLSYNVESHRTITIKRKHKGYGGLYWQINLHPNLTPQTRWDDPPNYLYPSDGDAEVILEPTRDWIRILGALMKAVNTGSLPDDAERVAKGILAEMAEADLSRLPPFHIQIDAYLYMAAIRPSNESAEGV